MSRITMFAVLLPLATVALSGCAKNGDVWSQLKDQVGPPRTAAEVDVSGRSQSAPSPSPAPSAPVARSVSGSAVAVPAYTYCVGCLLDGNGRVVPLSTTLRGDLEKATQEGDTLVFSGWGADMTTEAPVKSVLLVSNGTTVAAAIPDQPRPDISGQIKAYKNIFFGFDLKVPASQVGPTAQIWLVGADGKVSAVDKVLKR
ncbi:exported hypothetical protein [Candidatus Terasakiella magnetica]|nr:exported hypothetical protein [Candidatus Terasakiella magnetica]